MSLSSSHYNWSLRSLKTHANDLQLFFFFFSCEEPGCSSECKLSSSTEGILFPSLSSALNREQCFCVLPLSKEEKALPTFLEVVLGGRMLLLWSAPKGCGRTILSLSKGKLTWMPPSQSDFLGKCFFSPVFWLNGNTLNNWKRCSLPCPKVP